VTETTFDGANYSSLPTQADPMQQHQSFHMDDDGGLPSWAHDAPRTNR